MAIIDDSLDVSSTNLTHDVELSHLGPGLRHHLSHGHVQPGEGAPLSGGGEQKVVGEELQPVDVVQPFQAVDLDSLDFIRGN